MSILSSFLNAIKQNKYYDVLKYDNLSNEYNYIEYFYCLTYKDLMYYYNVPFKDSFYIIKHIKNYYLLDDFLKKINQKKYVINLLNHGYYSLEKLKKVRLNYLIKWCNIKEKDAKFIFQSIKN
jgi:hypothetical protein